MHRLNLQAKEEIKGWIDYRTPWEYQKSPMLLGYITKKAIEIGETTKDERVQLEAMARLADIDAQKRQLLSDTFVINSAIGSLQKQKKYEILENSKARAKVQPQSQSQSQDIGFHHQSKKEDSEQNEQTKKK